MEYEVIVGSLDSKYRFEARVADYLARGWETAGGVALLTVIGDDEAVLTFAQAMVKKE